MDRRREGRRQGRGRRLPPSDDQMFSFGSPNKVSGEGDRCVFGWFARLALLAHSLPLPHSLLPAHSSFHNITPLTRYQNTSAATVAARLASPPGRQPSPRTTETNAARSGPKRGRREKCPRSNQCTGGNRPHRRWGCPSKKRSNAQKHLPRGPLAARGGGSSVAPPYPPSCMAGTPPRTDRLGRRVNRVRGEGDVIKLPGEESGAGGFRFGHKGTR